MKIFLNTKSVNKYEKEKLYLSTVLFFFLILIPSLFVLGVFIFSYYKFFKGLNISFLYWILFISFICFLYKHFYRYITYVRLSLKDLLDDDVYKCDITDSIFSVSKNDECMMSFSLSNLKSIDEFRGNGLIFNMLDGSYEIVVGIDDNDVINICSFLENVV